MQDATLQEKELVTENIGILRFDLSLKFTPGQFCNITLEPGVMRPYSMTSVPGEQAEFYIKSYPDGAVAHKILDLEPGAEVGITGPLGQFRLRDEQDSVYLIGAGSGVAPLVSMARVLESSATDVILLHGASHTEELGYEEELREFDDDSFTYVPTVSRPEANESWDGRTGRVESHIDVLEPGAEVYVCGPPPMVQKAVNRLQNEGFKNIYTEQYY